VLPSSDATRGTIAIRLAVVLAVLAAAGVAAGVMLDTEPGGDEIADRVAERYDDAESYTTTVAVSVTYENETDTVQREGRARLVHAAPDSYRAEVLAPRELEGAVAATNGSVAWVDRPGAPTTVRAVNDTQQEWLARANLSAALDKLQENATITREGTTTLDGTETYVLSVEPDAEYDADDHDGNATVWVDTEANTVEQIRTTASHNGTTVTTTVRYENTTFGVSVHESTFQPPTDRSVVLGSVDQRSYDSLSAAAANVSFEVRSATVPADFEEANVVVSERGDDETLAVTYENASDRIAVVRSERNPLARVSVDTESVTVADANASYLRERDTGVVFWQDDGRTYAVAGSVSRETLVSVAESLA